MLACVVFTSDIRAGTDFSARVKAFGTVAALPEHDQQRQLAGTPVYDQNPDLRLQLRHDRRGVALVVDHSTVLISGDSVQFTPIGPATLEQLPTDDDRRIMDLTWQIEDGSRHRSFHRLDRLALKVRRGDWALTLGRQALSWGGGLAFQPMDLFNPFAPTTVDTEFKAGDDLLLAERVFADGSDLQLLAVGRRDSDGDVTGQAASVGAKWRGFVGDGEFEVLAAKHYVDQVYGIGVRWPLGGALLRSDLIATHLRDSQWEVSAVANIDYTLEVAARNTYLFAEYYRNGFGVDDLPRSALLLPEPLLARIERGEVFTLMTDYVALGANVEWHPLWNQDTVLITNLRDGSNLLQVQLSHDPGDHQRLQLGVLAPLGSAGEEFGGVPLITSASGEVLTAGGGIRGYLRWAYYF